MIKHTPGAMRAAMRIDNIFQGQDEANEEPPTPEWVAEIIDAETGLANLLAAAKYTAEHLEPSEQMFGEAHSLSKARQKCLAAIAKAEGQN